MKVRTQVSYLHPNHLDPVDSSPSSLTEELCQGLLSYCEKTGFKKVTLSPMELNKPEKTLESILCQQLMTEGK